MRAGVRVFRWDGDTVRLAWLVVELVVTDAVVGRVVPWWVTAYVVMLSVALVVAGRALYWRKRQVQAERAERG